MKSARILAGLALGSALALGLGTNAAYAAGGLVDGSITVGDSTCSWTNATSSDVPPNTLTIDHTTVQPSCSGSITGDITNDPTVTFDDAAGTARVPELDVTASMAGNTCGYAVTDLSLTRQGTGRTYSGGPYTATKTSGGSVCSSTATLDAVTLSFH